MDGDVALHSALILFAPGALKRFLRRGRSEVRTFGDIHALVEWNPSTLAANHKAVAQSCKGNGIPGLEFMRQQCSERKTLVTVGFV